MTNDVCFVCACARFNECYSNELLISYAATVERKCCQLLCHSLQFCCCYSFIMRHI